jgi:hypothetical protein
VPHGRAKPPSSKAKPLVANVQMTGATSRGRQHPAQQFGLFPVPFDIAGNGRWVQSKPRGSRQATHVSSNVDKHDRYTKRVADGGRKAGVEERS